MFGQHTEHRSRIDELKKEIKSLKEASGNRATTVAEELQMLTSRLNRLEHDSVGIKASDAKEAANYFKSIAEEQKPECFDIHYIERCIRDAAVNGNTRLDVCRIVSDPVHDELIKRGFGVSFYDGYYNRSTIITWSDKEKACAEVPTWHKKENQ